MVRPPWRTRRSALRPATAPVSSRLPLASVNPKAEPPVPTVPSSNRSNPVRVVADSQAPPFVVVMPSMRRASRTSARSSCPIWPAASVTAPLPIRLALPEALPLLIVPPAVNSSVPAPKFTVLSTMSRPEESAATAVAVTTAFPVSVSVPRSAPIRTVCAATLPSTIRSPLAAVRTAVPLAVTVCTVVPAASPSRTSPLLATARRTVFVARSMSPSTALVPMRPADRSTQPVSAMVVIRLPSVGLAVPSRIAPSALVTMTLPPMLVIEASVMSPAAVRTRSRSSVRRDRVPCVKAPSATVMVSAPSSEAPVMVTLPAACTNRPSATVLSEPMVTSRTDTMLKPVSPAPAEESTIAMAGASTTSAVAAEPTCCADRLIAPFATTRFVPSPPSTLRMSPPEDRTMLPSPASIWVSSMSPDTVIDTAPCDSSTDPASWTKRPLRMVTWTEPAVIVPWRNRSSSSTSSTSAPETLMPVMIGSSQKLT